MKIASLFYTLLLFFTVHTLKLSEAYAEAKAAQKRLATACFACHGEKGISPNDLWPNLAGQKKEYIKKQLHDFKSGARKDVLMSPFAQTLTDEDIETVARYFNELNQ